MKATLKVLRKTKYDPSTDIPDDFGYSVEDAEEAMRNGVEIFGTAESYTAFTIADNSIMGYYIADSEENDIRLVTIAGEFVILNDEGIIDTLESIIDARTPGNELGH